jgi:transketolase
VAQWKRLFSDYSAAYPDIGAEYERRMRGRLPDGWAEHCRESINAIAREAKTTATRQASQRALEAFAPMLPELIGGSADLTGSNNTFHSLSRTLSADEPGGNYLHFGVREFAMVAITNGLSLHGGFIPYAGTFLVFSDYARNAMRMAALMRIRSVYVLTHDSIGLGEDGPTHQPVEHIASLRCMPNMTLWRPCDGVETAIAWRAAIERREGPTSLVLSRQSLPHFERTDEQLRMIERGGYILWSSEAEPDLVLIATGSEVALAVAAAKELVTGGTQVRVVSMPCTEVFDEQASEYRNHVLPPDAAKLAIEAGVADTWWRYVGCHGNVVGMSTFGRSAPAKDLFEYFGFTVGAVVEAARRLI